MLAEFAGEWDTGLQESSVSKTVHSASEQLLRLTLKTPAGQLQVVTDHSGTVLSSGFGSDPNDFVARLGKSAAQSKVLDGAGISELAAVETAVTAWADGQIDALTNSPVQVWQAEGPVIAQMRLALRQVKAGSTVSYQQLAALVARPKAARVAAQACSRNMVAPFIPCHRVLRADGSLGGFYWGDQVKLALLRHEGVNI